MAETISSNAVQNQQRISASAPSQLQSSAASSTSTQWPSAPSSPDSQSQDVTNLQDILDRALHDPFSTHPEISAHLKSNIEKYCREAAEKIYEADVLLVVTGAGFSADSGLATYIDVADIDAYRNRGWSYRNLCKPPTFADFSSLTIGDEDHGGEKKYAMAKLKVVEQHQKDATDNGNKTELDDESCDNESDNEADEIDFRKEKYLQELHNAKLPDEDEIGHPQYFYGFWGQCCNDYRRVKPHEGYDIIANWGRDKNCGQKNESGGEQTSGINEYEGSASNAAQEIRNITQMLEQGDDNDSESSDDSESFNFEGDDEDEPYHVSPNKQAGAFFVFTSNVDAHSFDVFESHEIRECHGNVEMWQCHNVACGTNATICDGGSLDGIDRSAADGDADEKEQRAKKWQRRLWRLPMDHHFSVDCNSMCAPYSKTLDTATEKFAAAALVASSSPPASKRRKSSMTDDQDAGSTDTGADSRAVACADNNDSIDVSDTATALGGLMEDTWKKALKIKLCNDSSGKNRNTKESSLQPSHIGDVHGKPRLFPLRYMHPPPTDSTTDKYDVQTQNYFLPISADENWPRCPRCQEAARPAVLMFDDLDWVYNLKQERRWQRWCESLLKLSKRRSRVGADAALSSDSASTVSDTNMSEKGWEDVSDPEQKLDERAKDAPTSTPKPAADSGQQDTATFTSPPQSPNDDQPHSPLKVTILEIGCGYNVPTCRVITERLVCELAMRGGDATLVRINPSHPEPDDHAVEEFVISIMEKGLVALKMIQIEYERIKKEHDRDG